MRPRCVGQVGTLEPVFRIDKNQVVPFLKHYSMHKKVIGIDISKLTFDVSFLAIRGMTALALVEQSFNLQLLPNAVHVQARF